MMVRTKILGLLILVLMSTGSRLAAQVKTDTLSTAQLERYREQAESLVFFLEYALNVLGDAQASTEEKDIIIQDSYQKIFRDAKVQVEDDLVRYRGIAINKDVQAYLKDITFFFKQVNFRFEIEEVTHSYTPGGQLYFQIVLTRQLEGMTVENEAFRSTRRRYIELNLEQDSEELKIVSIYTTRLSEQQDFTRWWNRMPPAWKQLFASDIQVAQGLNMARVMEIDPKLNIGDTLFLADSLGMDTIPLANGLVFGSIKSLLRQDKLDLSGQMSLTSLEPLQRFKYLRKLDLSHTLVRDLKALRDVTSLEELDLSHSPIIDLAPLRYATKLRQLKANHTQLARLDALRACELLEQLECRHSRVSDLEPLANLRFLRDLDLSHTFVHDLAPLRKLNELNNLDVSFTKVARLDALQGLGQLEELRIAHTDIANLSPLQSLESLQEIFADHTGINDLTPLGRLDRLRRIYCDNSPVTREAAIHFMSQHPHILIVYQSNVLSNWWEKLPAAWQKALRAYTVLDPIPKKEQLQALVNVDTLRINGNRELTSLEPLQEFRSLKALYCRWTGISSLGPIRKMLRLEVLDCGDTRINSLAPISGMKNLRMLRIPNTLVSSLDALKGLAELEELDISGTAISRLDPIFPLKKLKRIQAEQVDSIRDPQALMLAQHLPACLLIYKTEELQAWWESLPAAWQSIFKGHVRMSVSPSAEDLHQVARLEAVSFSDRVEIQALFPLQMLLQLKDLRFENTRIRSLVPLSKVTSLEVLHCRRSPLSDLTPLSNLRALRVLDFQNTLVEDLAPISDLITLEVLKLAGTQINDLQDLENLIYLHTLDCSNTQVKKLKHLKSLKSLQNLVCFLSRISQKEVDKFKEARPDVKVDYY
jgi:Leucine-rich repeat (LRR) protein